MTPDHADKNSRQQRKKDRVREYFIDAAKQIILEEGVGSATVRNIADRAGYAYASLYNYFKDLNDLLWHTKQSVVQDVFSWMSEASRDLPQNKDGIKKAFELYMTYYYHHPNAFAFFYNYRLPSPDMPAFAFDTNIRGMFDMLAAACHVPKDDVQPVYQLLVYTVHGLLTLHFSGNYGSTFQMLVDEMSRMVDLVFRY